MRLARALLLIATLSGLSGCTGAETSLQAPPERTPGPSKLIAYSEHQKALFANNGADYINAAARANQAVVMTAKVGSTLVDDREAVWVEGKPFTGLQVILQGPVFQQGLLGPPRECRAEVRDEIDGELIQTATVVFHPAGPGSFRAQFPSLIARKAIKFHITAPAINSGESEYSLMVTGTKGDAIAYTETRKVNIRATTGGAGSTGS